MCTHAERDSYCYKKVYSIERKRWEGKERIWTKVKQKNVR